MNATVIAYAQSFSCYNFRAAHTTQHAMILHDFFIMYNTWMQIPLTKLRTRVKGARFTEI